MENLEGRRKIEAGDTAIGIELGSTRIKAVLVDLTGNPLASGAFEWENKFGNGVWTYALDDALSGLQAAFRALADAVEKEHGVPLVTAGAIGVSAMMHGYLAFDRQGGQLAEFRTWRNTVTGEAAELLTEAFRFNIPQRWSVAHLYQAMLNGEPHVKDVDFITTLAGYVHWRLTGEKVAGIGEASGMFPIDVAANGYDADMLAKFDGLAKAGGYGGLRIGELLPDVRLAGDDGGSLTEEGARLLDPSGRLRMGIPFCPPEGDAGTGMVATNSVEMRTGNVSAGTSIFLMIVLEKALSGVYPEIDIVTTPSGKPVALVHCTNCTTDIDAWVKMFGELLGMFGLEVPKPELYDELYAKALAGEPDGGGLLSFNYIAGEHITGIPNGRPLIARLPGSRLTVANLMRTLVFSAASTLRLGMKILTDREDVRLDVLFGHGGFFKSRDSVPKLFAAMMGTPVSVLGTAGEGGAWGIALLAAYRIEKQSGQTLEAWLSENVFAKMEATTAHPDEADMKGFEKYLDLYARGLALERVASATL